MILIPKIVFAQGHAATAAPAISASHAILIDYENGSILYEKAADTPFPPASLTKLMTMELVFQALNERNLSLDQQLLISPYAWKHGGAPSGGSTMFASINSKVKVEDLIQGVVVVSGNDAAIAFAEALDGNETLFGQHMTKRARELGLSSANFKNATGLYDPGHNISARDLARLTAHIIREYPDYFPYYSQRDFTWNKIKQQNRNPLLDMNIGADGMKTGYVKESGYNIVGTAVQNDVRLIVVVEGSPNMKDRGEDARKLLDWGFKNFEPHPLVKEGAVVAEASVFGGDRGHVPLVTKQALRVFLPKGASDRMLVRAVYNGPLRAPVSKGAEVARLKAWRGDRLVLDAPLYAGDSVGPGGLFRRAIDGVYELTVDLVRTAFSKFKRT
ncbi:MAG TPA: D-alanyl-D-alanine carboxypeptidase family protein [Xanthobacteraceae bacterium]|nr:D-alanyl-D-alanine carboxypeptidase family protein [Xanthobacteraceae bacterium]